MKIRPVGVDLFHMDRQAEGQTELKKLIVPFRNFAKAHENRDIEGTVYNMDWVELAYKVGRIFVQTGMNFKVS